MAELIPGKPRPFGRGTLMSATIIEKNANIGYITMDDAYFTVNNAGHYLNQQCLVRFDFRKRLANFVSLWKGDQVNMTAFQYTLCAYVEREVPWDSLHELEQQYDPGPTGTALYANKYDLWVIHEKGNTRKSNASLRQVMDYRINNMPHYPPFLLSSSKKALAKFIDLSQKIYRRTPIIVQPYNYPENNKPESTFASKLK